jgi:hypothetical protein
MKLLSIVLLLLYMNANSQVNLNNLRVDTKTEERWRLNSNRLITGGLVFLAGASKGFNETLMFHWDAFHKKFPGASTSWFNPAESWKNKYQDGDPSQGQKFPFSTTMLVMTTDQYHLDNFINRTAWMSTIIIKMSEGRKSFKSYLFDMLYYTACHQAGFAMTYYPFAKNKIK